MDYDPKNRMNFAHLTNNCLIKKYENSGIKEKKEKEHQKKVNNKQNQNQKEAMVDENGSQDSDGCDEDDYDPENIWSSDDFNNYL